MQKITEIKEYHTIQRKQMVNGIETYTEQKVPRFHTVNYVDGIARFGHFLLDRVFFYAFAALIGIPLGIILVFLNMQDILDSPYFNIFDTLFSWLILQPAYYFIFEVSIQSTPAKIILKRIVVDEYGNKPTPKQILIRSFTRSVPFEVFSCLGTTGWHDDWSKTFVIRKKDLEELKLLQKINNIDEQNTSTNQQAL
jgi:uncharacterized RDD family membrane protein YckC